MALATDPKGSTGARGGKRFWRRPFDAETIHVPRGEIHLLEERCKGCAFCVEYCPTSVLEMSGEFNLKGYHPPLARQPDKCVHCQLCETICPEFAIFVTLKNGDCSEQGGA